VDKKKQIAKILLEWHTKNGRHNLPWVGQADPSGYKTFLSEIMMQQTTVAVGEKRFPEFLKKFPTWEDLAAATEDDVMKGWEGLGYYRRARYLHASSKEIVKNHGGVLPAARADRLALPGVGKSTASALGSFVFGFPEPIWDANVERVFRRLFGDEIPDKEGAIWAWQDKDHKEMIPKGKERVWPQALMDFGSLLCLPRNPLCPACPLQSLCPYGQNPPSSQKDSPSTPKPVKQVVWKHWGVFVRDGYMAIHPPRQNGIWAGLWLFPEIPAHDLRNKKIIVSGSHDLSHRRILWYIALFDQKDDVPYGCELVSFSDIQQRGFPKPLMDFLKSKDFKGLIEK